MTLKIAQPEWLNLRQHGEETYPHECCGVLLGTLAADGAKTVQTIVRCRNQRSDSPHNRYVIDPHELVRIQREASARAQDIVGFYHSHPQHPAHWSPTDLEEAHWTGCSYVITSVMNGMATETNSFELVAENDRVSFRDEEITIVTP
jgi:proteasome lid subunit RPN8/RPN11